MGMPPFGGRSTSCGGDLVPGNPNPKRFSIARHASFREATVVEAVYPDAKNYEGRKIMVYCCDLQTILGQETLDPHFCDHGEHLAPFGRFEPTEAGWNAACALAEAIVLT